MGRPPAPGWRDLRISAGLTIRQVEERSGINRGELSRIERSRTCPTPDQAMRLLTALGRIDVVDADGTAVVVAP